MSSPTAMIWSLAFTVFTGILFTIILIVPSFRGQVGPWMIGATVFSALVSIPFAKKVAKEMGA